MIEEPIHEEKPEGESLSTGEEKLLDPVVVKEEDAAEFSSDLLHDLQENYTDVQRQNLYQKILKMTIPQKIRLAMLGNREARNILILDRNKVVCMAVLRSPRLMENDVLFFAQQRNIAEDVLRNIGKEKRWAKNYTIKVALANNPKTPLAVAIRLLDHLHDNDLKALRRNKNVSSVLNRAAFQVQAKRGISS